MPLAVGDYLSFVSIGQKIVQYLNGLKQDELKSGVLDSLRRIYFDRDSIALMRHALNSNADERHHHLKKLSRKLLDGRYEVHRSLVAIEEDGFRDSLSLKEQRLFDHISRQKANIRYELLNAVEFSTHDDQKIADILTAIDELNTAIETVDESIRNSARKLNG